MFLIIDTCFWNHTRSLLEANIIDLRPILLEHTIFLPDKIVEEIKYYKLDSYVPLNDILVLPISDEEIDENNEISYLDRADRSIIIAYERKSKKNPLILSDDIELVCECIQTNKKAINLPQFLIELVKNGLIPKNTAAKCFKLWTKMSAYQKKQIKKWKLQLQNIK